MRSANLRRWFREKPELKGLCNGLNPIPDLQSFASLTNILVDCAGGQAKLCRNFYGRLAGRREAQAFDLART